jgi:hypothetical protein
MPVKVIRYEPTPNPNALKCVLSGRVSEGSRPFRSAEAAGGEGGDPLAARLFAIDGVTGVLMLGDWVTVNKSPEAKWPAIKRGVEKALADHTA